MEEETQVLDATSTAADALVSALGRPLRFNARGDVQVRTSRGLIVNSQLRKDEWEQLDALVIEALKYNLVAVDDLRSRGLTQAVGFGTLTSQWNVASRMSAANVSMTGQGADERDRIEFDLAGVPIPVVSKGFSIGARQLAAARQGGGSLDLTHVLEAVRSVAETCENFVFNGHAMAFGGNTIYGYLNQPNRLTDTATNFGGGDWGTIGNIITTVAGMISAANAKNFRGPFVLYVSQDQYNEAALEYYDDGSAQTPIQRILGIPSIDKVEIMPPELVPSGNLALVQMTRNVIDWAEASGIQAMEWTSPDMMSTTYRIIAIGANRLKTSDNGTCGVVHATGA